MANIIKFVRGDTYPVNVSVTIGGVQYIPQAPDIITMTVRVKDHNGEIVIQKQTGDADVVVTDTGWQIILQAADTASLPYQRYVYDIELNRSGIIKTIIPMDKLELSKEVTY